MNVKSPRGQRGPQNRGPAFHDSASRARPPVRNPKSFERLPLVSLRGYQRAAIKHIPRIARLGMLVRAETA